MGAPSRGRTHYSSEFLAAGRSVDVGLSGLERVEHVHSEKANDENRDRSDERDHDAVLNHRGPLVAAEAGSQMPNVSNNW